MKNLIILAVVFVTTILGCSQSTPRYPTLEMSCMRDCLGLVGGFHPDDEASPNVVSQKDWDRCQRACEYQHSCQYR